MVKKMIFVGIVSAVSALTACMQAEQGGETKIDTSDEDRAPHLAAYRFRKLGDENHGFALAIKIEFKGDGSARMHMLRTSSKTVNAKAKEANKKGVVKEVVKGVIKGVTLSAAVAVAAGSFIVPPSNPPAPENEEAVELIDNGQGQYSESDNSGRSGENSVYTAQTEVVELIADSSGQYTGSNNPDRSLENPDYQEFIVTPAVLKTYPGKVKEKTATRAALAAALAISTLGLRDAAGFKIQIVNKKFVGNSRDTTVATFNNFDALGWYSFRSLTAEEKKALDAGYTSSPVAGEKSFWRSEAIGGNARRVHKGRDYESGNSYSENMDENRGEGQGNGNDYVSPPDKRSSN